MSKLSAEYIVFFASPAGLQLLTTITGMIDSNHEKAENVPEHARDHVQRAKGNREVLNLIKSLMIERKA